MADIQKTKFTEVESRVIDERAERNGVIYQLRGSVWEPEGKSNQRGLTVAVWRKEEGKDAVITSAKMTFKQGMLPTLERLMLVALGAPGAGEKLDDFLTDGWREGTARFKQRCFLCGRNIEEGENSFYNPDMPNGRKNVHPECLDKQLGVDPEARKAQEAEDYGAFADDDIPF